MYTHPHPHPHPHTYTHTHIHTHTQDTCKFPLVSSANMSHKFWSSKTTKTFIALLDNYEREVFFPSASFMKLAFKKKLGFSKNCFPHPSVPRPAFLSSITMSARCFCVYMCLFMFFFRPSSPPDLCSFSSIFICFFPSEMYGLSIGWRGRLNHECWFSIVLVN